MVRFETRGRFQAECDLEEIFHCDPPSLDGLVNRLDHFRVVTACFARFARGYLAFFVDEGLIIRDEADWVLATVAEERWLVHHLPPRYLQSSAY